MLSFESDYITGAHPDILRRLAETNLEPLPGYGSDHYCDSAKEKIRAAVGCPDAVVEFLTGGTQTNALIISAMLPAWAGVIAAETGHISAHEAGAVEYTGHKVLTLPQEEGRIRPADLAAFLARCHGDENREHMVYPGMVYLSWPTEYGTLYSRSDLMEISDLCRQYGMYLFIDGARLGYGLMSPAADLTLPELASLCDVFYIGGTKVGALCGEAVVFTHGNRPPHFLSTVKQHGALLAKGRLAGVQFDTLFTDGLYLKISHIAIDMAHRLKAIFTRRGIPFHIDSPTNQQFPILTPDQMASLRGKVAFEVWEYLPDGRAVTRFATSWATTQEQLDALEAVI
jgi:threonine aldolase